LLILEGSPVLDLKDMSFVGNGNAGISSTNPTPINAPHSWWGDPSGNGGDGTDSGDAVFGNVQYSPWRTAPDCGIAHPQASYANNMLTLTWQNSDHACGYELHRSGMPYFVINAGTLLTTLPTSTSTYTDPISGASTSHTDYFYQLRTQACTTSNWLDTYGVAQLHFNINP
jgi:hypothetical protein